MLISHWTEWERKCEMKRPILHSDSPNHNPEIVESGKYCKLLYSRYCVTKGTQFFPSDSTVFVSFHFDHAFFLRFSNPISDSSVRKGTICNSASLLQIEKNQHEWDQNSTFFTSPSVSILLTNDEFALKFVSFLQLSFLGLDSELQFGLTLAGWSLIP